jgi:hypothetical protein
MGEIMIKPQLPVDAHVRAALDRLRHFGVRFIPQGEEGRRRPGHCVYCNGQCLGATRDCEVRVYDESTERYRHIKR